jgi:S-adenosylmethionine-dependent methyltransferase
MFSSEEARRAMDANVAEWVKYNESEGGKLRHAIILNHLNTHLSPASVGLDAGGGTGELAADLAGAGHRVTMLDFSPAMIAAARLRCHGLNVTFVCADAEGIDTRFAAAQFDAVLCHSLIEFVTDPSGLIEKLARVLRPGGTLSVVFGNRYHTPLHLAVVDKNLRGARAALDAEPSVIDLFGLPRRTFWPETVHEMMKTHGLRVVAEYGVRVFMDLIGETKESWDDLLELELSASARMPYRQMARFMQLIAEKA